MKGAEIVFLSVGTPAKLDGSCDLSQLFSAVDAIAPHLGLIADEDHIDDVLTP
ncbi:MAG: hypothetical protein AAB426_02565 [Myxococcota bacterium]